MIRRPPRSTRTDTRFPYTTLFRSARDILVDILREHVERDVAALDDDIVEVAQVVARPQRRLGAAALADDLAMADLVAAGLAGPTAIAVDCAGDLQRVRHVAHDEEFDRFLARPALGVEAGVYDEAAGAEGVTVAIAQQSGRACGRGRGCKVRSRP